MNNCVDAIRAYFEVKNRVWINADLSALAQAARVTPTASWWKHISNGIAAKQRELKHRQSKLLRAHTHVNIQKVEEDGDRKAHAYAEEHVTWVYRDGPDYGVESRVVQHRQRWIRKGPQWFLDRAWESDESQHETNPLSSAGITVSQTGLTVTPDVYRNCTSYDRVRVLRYAELWWNRWNPSFPQFTDDCTNFVSQCLWAGNVQMRKGDSRASGWWYKFGQTASGGDNWSYSWSTSQALYLYLLNRLNASVLQSPRELRIGDLVFYDWDGSGRFHHTAVVTDFDHRGDPLVNSHTDASYHRHYLYLDSRAWTPNTKYAFVHLPDVIC